MLCLLEEMAYIELPVRLSILESIAKIGEWRVQHPIIFGNDLALDECSSVDAVLR